MHVATQPSSAIPTTEMLRAAVAAGDAALRARVLRAWMDAGGLLLVDGRPSHERITALAIGEIGRECRPMGLTINHQLAGEALWSREVCLALLRDAVTHAERITQGRAEAEQDLAAARGWALDGRYHPSMRLRALIRAQCAVASVWPRQGCVEARWQDARLIQYLIGEVEA